MGTASIRFVNNPDWRKALPDDFFLNSGEVQIYRIQISTYVHLIPKLATTLTQKEMERGNKYHQLKDRQRFVVSRGAQRYILGKYLNVPPEQLQFALGDNKKPHLVAPAETKIQYNITHAGDWIVLAVSNATVGADVEHIDPKFQYKEILAEHFSTEEVKFISEKNSTERFFLLWTRKEALLKATAQGLGEHLKMTPSLDGVHDLSTGLNGTDKNWQLVSVNVSGDHLASISAEGVMKNISFFDIELGK